MNCDVGQFENDSCFRILKDTDMNLAFLTTPSCPCPIICIIHLKMREPSIDRILRFFFNE